MEYGGKPIDSETPSDQETDKFTDENSGVGRVFECIFCKRGFTNAQALGGHMNIHRKDKAKAKQKARQSLGTSKSFNEQVMRSRNHDQNSSNEPTHEYYAVPVGSQQVNYQYFFPGSNPYNFSKGHHDDHHSGGFAAPRDHLISTKIDHCHHESSSRNNTWEEDNEVDLELRLS